ncbi:SDR family NAD(P)-dependent oxidoreductase [Paenibacillus sp. GCM10027626]|uniref:SDR family NAD(P)-dependent oxidoreductase n=1 Tax=Paenibacillus sp. GCM10027626 TaxID=3273411 RepID=UPI003641269F
MSDADREEMQMKELEGKVALITGAAQGIGEAIARRMLLAGAKVALSDMNEDAVRSTAARLRQELGLEDDRRISADRTDVSVSAEVSAWVGHVGETWGRVDILVNNAGIQLNKASVDISDEEWQRVLGVNLNGVFYCAREAAKIMLRQKAGCIINISSIAAQYGLPRRLPYGVTKAGVSHLTRVLAAEWAPGGIRVNAIGPGYIDTEINRYAFSQGHIKREDIEAKIPMGMLGDPREIAEAALFLASARAGYVTGQTIFVDGGYTITK